MKLQTLTILSLATATLAWAVPSEINYQGRLTDANGDTVTGDVAMSLKMFDAATAGNEIYSEDIGTVTLDNNGIYSFEFGASGQSVVDGTETIAGALSAADSHWLELSVDGTAQTPRERVLSVPFAQVAATVVSNAIPDVLSEHTGGAILSFGVSSELEGRGFLRAVVDAFSVEPIVSSLLSSTNALNARYGHSAVWTGSEMIIWGGNDRGHYPGPAVVSSGRRYDPATDTWITTPISTTGAPSTRIEHTAVWTGSEMIIWGGTSGTGYSDSYNSRGNGARYDPATDTWSAISTTNAPSGRYGHNAVWTGSEMIIYGGYGIGYYNNGARYNPATDTWSAISSSGGGFGRYASAVWTGSEMIIWGGYDNENNEYINTGARYDPATDTWTEMSSTNKPNDANAPSGRYGHTAVWTGSEMIIWGGRDNSSARNDNRSYDPGDDNWVRYEVEGDMLSARFDHSAVWTGSEMIIWGGRDFPYTYFSDGARYDVGYRDNLFLYVDPSALEFRQ